MLRLKELRTSRYLNQTGLALKLNISQSTISAYEKGERTPDLETLISMAQFFDVSLDYLVGFSSESQHIGIRNLSPQEIDFLRSLRRLPTQQQAKVQAYMKGLEDSSEK